jgi:SAM-dependent methyltransferase
MRALCSSLARRRAARLGRLLRQYVDDGELILDVGGGSLLVADELRRQRRVSVVGLDTLAYRKCQVPLALYDGRAAPFRDAAFDTVLAGFVLHHCEDGGVAVLREARRLARRRVLVLEDGYEHAAERLLTRSVDRLLNRIEHAAIPTPCRFRSAAQWRQLFGELGFAVAETRTVRTTPIFETRQVLFVLTKGAGSTESTS